MTNREWIESLTNAELAEFLTIGLRVNSVGCDYLAFRASISDIGKKYMSSCSGIEKWLASPQEFEVVR